jgi:ribosomal protein S18 acetylase RimI-like enzyme
MSARRPATNEDGDFLWKLYVSTRDSELARLGWPAEQQKHFLEMQYRARTGSYSAMYPDAERKIITDHGVPAGALIVARTSQEIRLVDIAFLPEFRNRGYGSGEIARLIQESEQASLPLRLSVMRGNPAIRLYQRLGFVATAEDSMYIEMEYHPTGGSNAC